MEPATTEIYRSLHPLSLHDALPISPAPSLGAVEREPLRRLDRTGTLVHQHHRQPVSRLQFTRERVGALADRLVAAVQRHRLTNHQAVRPPFGLQAVARLPRDVGPLGPAPPPAADPGAARAPHPAPPP